MDAISALKGLTQGTFDNGFKQLCALASMQEYLIVLDTLTLSK